MFVEFIGSSLLCPSLVSEFEYRVSEFIVVAIAELNGSLPSRAAIVIVLVCCCGVWSIVFLS